MLPAVMRTITQGGTLMKALILAAGKGTRMKHLTANCPKPMLPVGGRPLLDHTVAWLRGHGITDIAMNLHHAGNVIVDHFGTGDAHGVRVTYSHEPQLLGTAGAAKKLDAFLDETFVVVYGDVLTNVDLNRLLDFHTRQRVEAGVAATISLALYRVPNPTECGLVDLSSDGRVQRFVEKPPAHLVFTELANAGILVCDPGVLEVVPRGRFFDFAHDLFPLLMLYGVPLFGQPIADDEYVIDIGTAAGYERANTRLAAHPVTAPAVTPAYVDLYRGATLQPPLG